MDASPAQPQDVRDLVAAELAQKLLTELSGQQYLTRAEERAQETRVQELYVTHEVKTSEHVPAILQLSLPALRCCVVDGDRDEDLFRPTDSTTARAALLPNSKSLRALRLRWVCFMPPTSFPVLTVLHLAEIEHMRLIDLLRFLARTPLLQDLQLNRTAPKKLAAVDLSRWGHGRVRLRDLRRLVMEDHTSSYAILGGEPTNALAQYQRGLLSNLSIPPACAHAVEGVAGSGLVGDLLAELWPAGEQYASQIRIQGRSPPARTLKFVLHLSAEDGLDASFGVFEFNHLAGIPGRARLADVLSSGHVFRNIQRLWIGAREHLEWLYKDIGHILPALSTVEAIVIDGCMMPASFDALIKALAVSPDGTVQSAPSLSTLALYFGTRLTLKPPYELGSVGVGAVYEMQRSRAAARHPLRRLIHLPHTGRRTAYHMFSFEFNAYGVLVCKEPYSVVLRDLEKTWTKDGPRHGHLALIDRDAGLYPHGDEL
ncbi:hypothetical protein TRAPUB_1309 [Trametes pubescens]|uniref:F-box domain-containing protein n=1 Tax=Trametes pubescens TaxID=154538 RepID=A0A1M2VJL5_TRAPU|nr:hypothetical protein TRAPUB_1309 [Trametes pubescens]